MIAPAGIATTMNDSPTMKLTTPTKKAESVRSSASQPIATCCIQLLMDAANDALQSNRKSRELERAANAPARGAPVTPQRLTVSDLAMVGILSTSSGSIAINC